MDLEGLLNNTLVSRRENANDALEIATLFSSYANTAGGTVLFGVKESGKAVGVSPQSLIDDIKYALSEFGMDDIEWGHKQLMQGRHLFIEVSISRGGNKLAIQNRGTKEYYCRIRDKTIIANKIILKVWSLEEGRSEPKELDELEDEIDLLIKDNRNVSLAFLYRKLVDKNSRIEIALSQLIYKNRVRVAWKNDELKYSSVNI